jgi:Osmosensitive K+ channel histidine kinase
MHYPNAFSRFLLDVSIAVQFGIACLSILISLLIYFEFPYIGFHENFIVFIVPVVLCAWMFRGKGVFACIFASIVSVWLISIFSGLHNFPDRGVLIMFFFSLFALLFVGMMVSSQRNSLDYSDEIQQQLTIINEEQQHLSDIKDQFLQNVNHELRTPLTAIYGYLELLLEHNERLDNDMRVTFLQHAMQSCDELQLLVNNVLDTMGIKKERHSLCIEELVVRDILFEVLERFDPKSVQGHHIDVNIPDYIVVLANAQYLRQVFRNLLSNAFKYAPENTPVMISARLYGDVVDPLHAFPEICISVEDRGPGIPPAEIPQLFGQFVRLRRDTSGHIRGSGLGLFLSRQFMDAMGGRIWVESSGVPGEGSNFRFTLPCVIHPKVSPHTTPADFSQFNSPLPIDV